jgi:hypothetical protein
LDESFDLSFSIIYSIIIINEVVPRWFSPTDSGVKKTYVVMGLFLFLFLTTGE